MIIIVKGPVSSNGEKVYNVGRIKRSGFAPNGNPSNVGGLGMTATSSLLHSNQQPLHPYRCTVLRIGCSHGSGIICLFRSNQWPLHPRRWCDSVETFRPCHKHYYIGENVEGSVQASHRGINVRPHLVGCFLPLK